VSPQTGPEPNPETLDLESTATLLLQVRQGNVAARERLVSRYLGPLERWAHGRLPSSARDLAETSDLVQVTLLKALNQVGTFEPRHEGAFLAYLRRILWNEIRGEIRRVGRRPKRQPLSDDLVDGARSPLDQAIGREAVLAYEKALSELDEEEREGIILRFEFGFTHREVAVALGRSSPDAARMLVTRAVMRLSEKMHV